MRKLKFKNGSTISIKEKVKKDEKLRGVNMKEKLLNISDHHHTQKPLTKKQMKERLEFVKKNGVFVSFKKEEK